MASGSGFTAVELKSLGSKPRGDGVTTPAWKYLKGAHETVQGILDGMTLVRRTAAESRGDEYRGRLGRDQEDLLRAALMFTSSGLDVCCKRLVRDAAPLLIEGNADAARKFDEFLTEELSGGPSDALSAAVRSRASRDELVRLYVAAKTKASMQGDEDVRKRVRDTLGIPNAMLRKQRLGSVRRIMGGAIIGSLLL